jgi:membrane associated rhomboid family serine protease
VGLGPHFREVNIIALRDRFIIASTTVIYLSMFVTSFIAFYTINIPAYTVYGFQGNQLSSQDLVWRIFTASLVHTQLLNYLFSMLSYVPTAMSQEKESGTVRFAANFLATSTVIQVLYVLFILLLSINSKTIIMQPAMGLWPVVMCDIVVQCNKSPEVARW